MAFAKLLFIGTSGSENPTKAVLPLLSAIGAIEAGHQPMIALNDLHGKNASFINPKRGAELTLEADRVVAY